jgi:hypothetical protein
VPSLFEGRFGENAGRSTTVGMQMLSKGGNISRWSGEVHCQWKLVVAAYLLVENLFLIVVGRNLNWYRDNSLTEIDRDCSIEELTIRERA